MGFFKKLFGGTSASTNVQGKRELDNAEANHCIKHYGRAFFDNLPQFLRQEYGLVYGCKSSDSFLKRWSYERTGINSKNTITSQSHDPARTIEHIKKTFPPLKGFCVVPGHPSLIAFRTDKGPFCMSVKGEGDFIAMLCKEYKINLQKTPVIPFNGCMLFHFT